MDWFKPSVGDIVLTDRLLRREKRKNVEGGNGGRSSTGCMGM